ncbi:flagellum-specific ATP synthase [Desulfurispira natronophila]|uniref:Flagellum-specific ATP synthase n=2 Tax=Desulfurispira natronophila TaxID=682562 RepID=A0A7W8DHG0_9BACT|nr:flagellum-specific ATP synthase [Desulfurispira natronophila]
MDKLKHRVDHTRTVKLIGKVTKIIGLLIESRGPASSIGDLCLIHPINPREPLVTAEVVGFREDVILLMPLGDLAGIGPGSRVEAMKESFTVPVGESLIGRVLDGLGQPIDDKPEPQCHEFYPVHASPPNPFTRKRIDTPIGTGVRAIDGLLTWGKGQRVGIFAGSGVGKSTLLGMISKNSQADINVIALIGERGREVREFIERDLGAEGLARSVIVVATSDQPALVRRQGAYVATAIAEYFRDQGRNVMFMMDSITRFCMSQREIGLAVGEPPTTKGYTPSVFALLPKLMERTGTGSGEGSISALYTVLVDGDDITEPVADASRSILDGHIMLSRHIAAKNHFPAIDVLGSASRVFGEVAPPELQDVAGRMRALLATYHEAEDLINIGAYSKGTNKSIDQAVNRISAINDFLRQGINESEKFENIVPLMRKAMGE